MFWHFTIAEMAGIQRWDLCSTFIFFFGLVAQFPIFGINAEHLAAMLSVR